jgi:hypothetical protein
MTLFLGINGGMTRWAMLILLAKLVELDPLRTVLRIGWSAVSPIRTGGNNE